MHNTSSQYDNIIKTCRKLYEDKLSDYGASWRILRLSSLTDQIFIKANRIRSIQESGVSLVDEGVLSEFVGMVNYGLIALIQIELQGESIDKELTKERALELYDKYARQTKELMEKKNHDYSEAWRQMRVSSITDLIRLGSNAWERRWSKWLFAGSKKQVPVLDVTSIVQACGHMSQSLTGALIVFCKSNPLDQIAQTGDCFSSEINSRLLETIFFKNTPLHDGALIIENGRIKAARCILPVSKNPDIPPSMGLRHRSAVGVTEQTDAIAVIVSEQTGKISVAKNGTVRQGLSTNELQQYLNKEFNE